MKVRGRWAFAAAGLLAFVVIGSALAATSGHQARRRRRRSSSAGHSTARARWPRSTIRRSPRLSCAWRVEQEGRCQRAQARDPHLRHAGERPATAKACALRLLGQKANVLFTTCDVDLAAPVVRAAIDRGVLAIAPCIGTDQMGPKRFGSRGRLAFSFGNVAQDEGSAMAQYAWNRGWKTAALATDTVIVYFNNVVQAFEARFKQLGGKIVAEETYQSLGGNNVQNAVSRLNNVKAAVIVTSTAGAFGALSTLLTGLRTLGNNTPVLNSWAGDGTYWLPTNPKVTQLLVRHVRVVLRRRSEQGGQRTGEAGQGGDRRLRHRAFGDRRAQGRDQAGARLDEGHRPREGDGEVQEACRRSPASSASPRSCTRCSAVATE